MNAVPSAELSLRAAREGALAALTEQQARFGSSAARDEALRRLRAGHGAVVTGQQLGLFMGPAYTVYKAATVIIEARRRDAVPIFWLQSEDHDLEEVRRCHALDASGTLVTAELPADPARISMAHRRLDGGVTGALEQLARGCDEAPHKGACLSLLTESFRPGRAWVDAFGQLLASLFDELLILDPRTVAMARVAQPLHRWAIDQADSIEALLAKRVAELGSAQVPVREGCLLSFFHPGGPETPRHRPRRSGDGYCWPGVDMPISRTALLDALDEQPLSWSTSALLRPLLQDLALPTVATVGGPSELRYLRQVEPLYEALGVDPPALVQRARFAVTDARSRRRLRALGVSVEAVEQPEAKLLDMLGPDPAGPDGDAVVGALLGPLAGELERLAPELQALDPGLARAISRTSAHVTRGVEQLGRRVDRARRRRDAVLTERVEYLQTRLFPDGVPQERVLGFAHFAAWHGPERFVQAALEAVGEDRTLKELAL